MAQNSADINRGQAIAFNGGHAIAFDRAREIGSYGTQVVAFSGLHAESVCTREQSCLLHYYRSCYSV